MAVPTSLNTSAPPRYKFILNSSSGVLVKQLPGPVSTTSGNAILSQALTGSIANSLKSQPTHVTLKTSAAGSQGEPGSQKQQRLEVKFVLDPNTRQMALVSMADLAKLQPLFQKTGVLENKLIVPDLKPEISALIPSGSKCVKVRDDASPSLFKIVNGMPEENVIGRLPDGLTIVQNHPKQTITSSNPRCLPRTESAIAIEPASSSPPQSSPSHQQPPPALELLPPLPRPKLPIKTETSPSVTVNAIAPSSENEMSPESTSQKIPDTKVKDVVIGRLPDGLTISHTCPVESAGGVADNAENEDSEIQIVAEKKFTPANKEVTSVPVLKTGSLPITNANLLSVRPAPLNVKHLPRSLVWRMVEKFRERLKQDNCLSDPVIWLSRMKLLPSHTSCQSCSRKTYLHKDSSFIDGYSWRCSNSECMKTVPVPRLICSSRVEIPLSKLLLLIFHWSAESNIDKVSKDVGLNVFLIRCVYQDIQEVCKRALTKAKKVGGYEKIVEVAVVQIGKYFVLGVMDRNSRKTRLRTAPVRLGYQPHVFRNQIEAWVAPLSTVVSDHVELLDSGSKLFKYVISDKSITDPKADGFHALNINVYLRLQLLSMFGKLWMNRMKIETLQLFLDELQWRDRFRITIGITFWNILKDMAEQNGTKVSGIPAFFAMATSKMLSMDVKPELTNSDLATEMKVENAQSVLPSPSAGSNASDPDIDEKKKSPTEMMSVVLDEYYYARIEPTKKIISSKDKWSFKCHFCKRMFSDNLKLMNHIIAHVEESRRCKLDLSDLTRCKHCFRDFSTPYNMQCHMEAVHLKVNPLACQICQLEFCFADSLISHMKNLHMPLEMPYRCCICAYRSSVHKDVLEHFNKVHHHSDYVLCPFCLKAYAVRFSNKSYSNHLFRHQFRSSVKKCTSCCLTFLSASELQAHRYDDHRTGTGEKGVAPFKTNGETIIIEVLHRTASKPQVTKPEYKVGANKLNVQKVASNSSMLKIANHSMTQKVAANCNTLTMNSANSMVPTVNIAKTDEPPGLKMTCIECRKDLEKDHFKRHVSCGRCTYSTNCSAAFAEHMISAHSYWKARRLKEQLKNPLQLSKSMFCACGFASKMGNKLASHLVKCGKVTCYKDKPEVPVPANPSQKRRGSAFDSDSEMASDSAEEGDDELDVSTDDSFKIEREMLPKNEIHLKHDSGEKRPVLMPQKCWAKRTFSRVSVKNTESPPVVETDPAYSVESHSASFPPLVVLDDDEEMSINESFAKVTPFVDTVPECPPSVPENTETTEVPMEEVIEEEPDMLQALGLIQIKSTTR